MNMKSIISLMLVMVFCSCSAHSAETSQGPTQTQKLYLLKTPVKVIREWDISTDILVENPQFNTSDYKIIDQAIENEEIDEMSTRIVTYEFNDDGKINDWVELYSNQTPVKVRVSGLPGIFNVDFDNGLPTKFTLDKEAFQKDLDEGKIFLDAYEKGLEYFTITYDENGFPSQLSGQSLEFFGGDPYKESYSKYVIDRNGNWTTRIVDTPYETKKQFRAYEY